MLSQWCVYQWSPQVSSWVSQCDYSCYTVNRPLWHSPPANYNDLIKQCDQLFWCIFLCLTEYEDEDIPKIHLTAEQPPWNPSTSEYSERETQMLDHWGQIIILATAARGPVYDSTVILNTLVYDAADVMDNDSLVTSLSAQIQIS